MPIVRNEFLVEREGVGRSKKYLDVLLWGNNWSRQNLVDLHKIEILRDCLRSLQPTFCDIQLYVPETHTDTIETLAQLSVKFVPLKSSSAALETIKDNAELANAAGVALTCDADVLVVKNLEWLPYVEELADAGVFLADTDFLKYYCEIFVKGHDVPWAFATQIWGLTWNGFYQIAEQQTFKTGMDFLYRAQKKQLNSEAQETGRSLIHNRLPNICFTRDRLLFYEIQKMAALRAKWRQQRFAFEIGYYLNFYYPLIFGGFDHIALLVNQCLQLGIPEKNVGATYQVFLDALRAKNTSLHAIFTGAKEVEFIKRVAYLRHFASHRGTLAPGKLIEKPKKELTDDEVDKMITEADMDDFMAYVPEGELREGVRQMLRYNFRMEHYESEGTIVDGVVPIILDGEYGFICPANDIDWNFQKFMSFMNRVLIELTDKV